MTGSTCSWIHGIGSVFVLVFLISCAGSPEPDQKEEQLIQQIEKSWTKADNERVFNLAQKYLKRYPNGRFASKAWLRVGQIQFLFQNYDRALNAVQKGLAGSPDPEIKAPLYQLRGKIYSRKHNYEEARKAFRQTGRYLRDYPEGEKSISVAYLLYRIGYAWIRTGHFSKGKEIWEQVVERYPDTEIARRLRNKKLPFFQRYFAIQMGAFLKRENAEELKSDLEEKGFNPYIERVRANGQMYYCVREGRFKQYRNARKKAQKLKHDGKSVFIIP